MYSCPSQSSEGENVGLVKTFAVSEKVSIPGGKAEEFVTIQNCLYDIIGWLKSGMYVVIHSKTGRSRGSAAAICASADSYGRFFHKCQQRSDEQIKEYI